MTNIKETKTANTIATFEDAWNDECKLVEFNGAIFKQDDDGDLEAVFFDQHTESGKVPMNREAVKSMGFEVCDDGQALPSHCFEWDMEQEFGKEVTEKLMEFFQSELAEADEREQAYIDELKAEAEAMKD